MEGVSPDTVSGVVEVPIWLIVTLIGGLFGTIGLLARTVYKDQKDSASQFLAQAEKVLGALQTSSQSTEKLADVISTLSDQQKELAHKIETLREKSQ